MFSNGGHEGQWKKKIEKGLSEMNELQFSSTVLFRLVWCTDSSTPLGGGFVGCSFATWTTFVSGVIFVNQFWDLN